jgi:hypothetical protein
MTNSRHSTSRRSFVLTVDTVMFEPELDEGCTVIIDPDRAFTVGSLVAVQAFAHREDNFPLLVRWLGSYQRDDAGQVCKPGDQSEMIALVLHGEGHRRYAWASSETDGTNVATVSGNRSSH